MSFLVGLDLNDVQVQTDSGDASTTVFTLTVASTTNAVATYISGVRQLAGTDYSVSGTTITFTTAPPTGTNNIMYVYTKAAIINTPADNSVTSAKIVDGTIVAADLADNAITLAKMAHGTDGNLITYDAAGAPAAVATGDSGQLLTSGGVGVAPTFATAAAGGFTLGTEVATTSGTSVTIGSIPAGVTMINIMLDGVSCGDTWRFYVQIGDSGGLETSGYLATSLNWKSTTPGAGDSTLGFIMENTEAADAVSGTMVLTLEDSTNFTWTSTHLMYHATNDGGAGGGRKSLSSELTQIALVKVGGIAFDAGAMNISYQ